MIYIFLIPIVLILFITVFMKYNNFFCNLLGLLLVGPAYIYSEITTAYRPYIKHPYPYLRELPDSAYSAFFYNKNIIFLIKKYGKKRVKKALNTYLKECKELDINISDFIERGYDSSVKEGRDLVVKLILKDVEKTLSKRLL